MQHLAPGEIDQIVNAFGTLPLQYDLVTRNLLMAGIATSYVGLLPTNLPPIIQLRNDLTAMNQIERLADGTVPLRTWLNNVASLSGPLEVTKVFLKLYDDVGHSTSGAPRIAVAALPEVKEKVVHRDDMVSMAFVASALACGAAVAKLRIPRFDDGTKAGPPPVNYLGTGWLVAKDLMVTNHHVVNARNENEPASSVTDLELQVKSAVVEFDYDTDDKEGTVQAVAGLEAWQPDLDYAILRLTATTRAPLLLAAKALAAAGGEYPAVNIIQHPRGSPKRYAIRNNLVSHVSAGEIRYFTDTDSGSSGSPVFDDTWRVVALHRGYSFVDGVSFQGRSTAWVNLGTPIHAIIGDVQKRYPALAAELQWQ